MNDSRYGLNTEAIKGKIYAIGGYDGKNYLSTVEVYDSNTNKWTKIASMHDSRYDLNTEVINGKIYAIGGRNANGNLSTVEVYDPNTNKWTQIASMHDSKNSFQTEVINGKIYVMGGIDSKGVISTVEVYDPDTNKWTPIASMNNPRAAFQTEVINGKIYAIGGRTISSVEVFATPGSTTNSGDSTKTDTPSKLIAVGGDSKVDLTWPKTDNASFIVKRSTTEGGSYSILAAGITGNTYTDSTVTNGITYYYVITVIKVGSESVDTNEATATPSPPTTTDTQTSNNALLVITMQNGERKEYDLTMEKVNDFMSWYNNPPASQPTYAIDKNYNKASFTSRKDYISYKQISSAEVNEYNI